ncbi:DUF6053 domain-containing protein [Lysobacter enzymogenes]|uniref:DUF6053 domain-containing protein n=1 Tax=Lysobacter enzymogenes TaxID=69 RepID=UPI003D18BCE7
MTTRTGALGLWPTMRLDAVCARGSEVVVTCGTPGRSGFVGGPSSPKLLFQMAATREKSIGPEGPPTTALASGLKALPQNCSIGLKAFPQEPQHRAWAPAHPPQNSERCSASIRTGAKLRRCCGHGPCARSASRCAAVE